MEPKKTRKNLVECHCCGEARWITEGDTKATEHRFYQPEHGALVHIRTFYQHDHERAEKRIAKIWDLTLDEFKATRVKDTNPYGG